MTQNPRRKRKASVARFFGIEKSRSPTKEVSVAFGCETHRGGTSVHLKWAKLLRTNFSSKKKLTNFLQTGVIALKGLHSLSLIQQE
ncbi:hypothetical protein RUM43_012063 [Polyplax serrata]|uniref:Uncharacterized protein n=1 Tax=Polyplax serrata TaxID=468196 RepID=A0AAN8S4B8_POLSC